MTIYRTMGFLSSLFLMTAVVCGGVYRLMDVYVDARGALHEAFFLIPLGWLSLALGLLLLIGCLSGWLVRRDQRRR